MKVQRFKNKLIIDNPADFDVVQTLNCGQIFRYVIDANSAVVFSKDKCANISFSPAKIEILSNDVDYFYHFFDLDRDYSKIKRTLEKDEFLRPAIKYGYGIRILNNDLFEMIVSFIISANNNIGRIKKSIEYLCRHFGSNMGNYHAFPTLAQLKKASVKDYQSAGLGYRAEQMAETISRLTEKEIESLNSMTPSEQRNFLISLKGVGEKVANCIMLFGLGVKSVFPVDTWINKVYNALTNTQQKNRKLITEELYARYGELSGYAQQYFFYYYRDNKIK